MTAPDVRRVRLRWTGEDLVFRGGPDGGVQIGVDSAMERGQSPMQLLLMAIAGCMAVDVRMILEKSRVPVHSLEVEAIGVRAEEPPKRFVSVELLYRLGGPSEPERPKVDRAVRLSRETYCSVIHTLDPALELDVSVELV